MGFHSVLKLLSKLIGIDYYAYLGEVRAHLSTIFKECNNKLGCKGPYNHPILVKKCLGCHFSSASDDDTSSIFFKC